MSFPVDEQLLAAFKKLSVGQSQKHGFDFENEIRTKVFDLKPETNNTDIHDIPHTQNKFDKNENISIKVTKNPKSVECGDILRFFDYDFNFKNTIIVGKWKQLNQYTKKIYEIVEIDYNQKFHEFLFGGIPREELEEYIALIKAIPYGNVKDKSYIEKKKELQKKYNMQIIIHPKVDSKKQRRVQCSIPFVEEFITYKGETLRGKSINTIINSGSRKFKKQPESVPA